MDTSESFGRCLEKRKYGKHTNTIIYITTTYDFNVILAKK